MSTIDCFLVFYIFFGSFLAILMCQKFFFVFFYDLRQDPLILILFLNSAMKSRVGILGRRILHIMIFFMLSNIHFNRKLSCPLRLFWNVHIFFYFCSFCFFYSKFWLIMFFFAEIVMVFFVFSDFYISWYLLWFRIFNLTESDHVLFGYLRIFVFYIFCCICFRFL